VSNIISLVVSSAFSAAAVLFSGAVWWTHRERLKFDLYNRRFDIYSRTLDFYYAVSEWTPTEPEKTSSSLQDSPKLERALRAFNKAIIEAQLLFDDDSGIQEQLVQIKDDTFKIIGYRRDIVPQLGVLKEILPKYQKLFLEPLQRIEASVDPSSNDSLVHKMSKYLKYKRIFFLPR